MVTLPATKPLSARQQRILDYVREFWLDKGYSPTYREIGIFANAGSPGLVHYHLRVLQRRGLLKVPVALAGKTFVARAIIPTGDVCHCCGHTLEGGALNHGD